VLTSRVEHPPLPALETTDTGVPPRGMRGGMGRVRERLYKVVTESAPMATSHNGQGNGHGDGHGNGHGDGHENGHAIGSGATSTAGQGYPEQEDEQQ
jgi:hypothetical protein